MRFPGVLLVFLAPVTQVSSNVEGDKMSVTRATGSSLVITCDLTQNINYIHWYRFREGTVPQRLLYYDVSSSKVTLESGISPGRYHAYQSAGKSYQFVISNLEESDSGTYYCAVWEKHKKIFEKALELIVAPYDINLASDLSPKPTVFLPSIAEIKLHNAGTYLCLLENFFPNVIKVYWKEKNGNKVLESQQGNTMRTTNTYMKFSWLTVSKTAMDKEHKCVVKHEKNRGGVDQEIIFPSVNEVVTSVVTTTEPPNDCLNDGSKATGIDSEKACKKDHSEVTVTDSKKVCQKDESNSLQLQLENTSAYYTYLLLLLESTLYFAIIICCLFRRTVCSSWKTS
uniref:Ig-like domain-containing protein n=1 Tax=Sus scrofa TaxID=9823 RepID=A0A8D0NDS2_PIG